jgi:CubicO group peptidase (beta-lactamase class C family)
MSQDAIFRIYSMTKPVTGVAMMILYEEGKWKPGDPLSKYIPEFADLKVYAGHGPRGQADPGRARPRPDGGRGDVAYGRVHLRLLRQLARRQAVHGLEPALCPVARRVIARMGKLPLVYQPGEEWLYSVSVDVQGYLVQKLSGKPFPDFVRERIFVPLA